MGKITAIKVQQKNRRRFSIYIDDDFAFGVHEDVLVWHKLAVGKELSETMTAEVLKAEEQSKANNYALNLLGYRARSEHEIKFRLGQRGYEGDVIEATVIFLKANGYIDDYAFAKSLVRYELDVKHSGEALIVQKLIQKGISQSVRRRVMEEILSDEDLLSGCEFLAEKKLNTTYKNDAPRDKMRKVVAFLQRRGYHYSMIREVLGTMLEED